MILLEKATRIEPSGVGRAGVNVGTSSHPLVNRHSKIGGNHATI